MSRMIFLILVLLCLPVSVLANPSFTIGSNQYLTTFAYPHDILSWPDRGLYLYTTPQTLPWQGDVSDITNRPSESYTNNYQQVEFAAPSGYDGDPAAIRSWMEVSSYVYRTHRSFGYLTGTRYGKILFEIGHTSQDMELEAKGVARSYETDNGATEYTLVPFNGKTEAEQNKLEFKVIFADSLFHNPLGIKIHYKKKKSHKPNGFIQFTRDGDEIRTPHLTWGWATTGCNHIFGYSHINADAFFLNEYSLFSGHQLNLQASYEHNGNYKSGLRYRRTREDGDTYDWDYDEGEQYLGSYQPNTLWRDHLSDNLLRGYSKVIFCKRPNLDAGILFLGQYTTHNKAIVSKVSENSDPNSEEKDYGLTLETNPFANLKFAGGYVDLGLLMELTRHSSKNTNTRWNSASHADERDVLWSTSPNTGWSKDWEEFSKGSEWYFATGLEAYSSIGIYKRTSLILKLTLLRKYTRDTRLYGQSEVQEGGSYKFYQTHERNNYRNETWMTGAIGLAWGRGPIQTFLTMQLPLAYLIRQETKLRDNDDWLFEHEKRNMWQVQVPTTLRLLLVYSL